MELLTKLELVISVELLLECVKKSAFLNLTQTRATSYNTTGGGGGAGSHSKFLLGGGGVKN